VKYSYIQLVMSDYSLCQSLSQRHWVDMACAPPLIHHRYRTGAPVKQKRTFSGAEPVDRYNQRKNYEEEEANAIGTEYLWIGLLPAADVAGVRAQLLNYLDQRILFYTS
jgi:hypothetical protein